MNQFEIYAVSIAIFIIIVTIWMIWKDGKDNMKF